MTAKSKVAGNLTSEERKSPSSLPKLNLPFRTSLLYLLFGVLWILLSDQLLDLFVPDHAKQLIYQTFKGWFFVLISGILLYVILLTDLTERKQSEEALRESEERFSKAFYQSPIGLILIDMTDHTIRDINDTILKMIGLPREQVIGQNDLQLGLQIEPEVYAVIGRELSEHGMFRNKEIQVRLPNGDFRHVLNSGALITIQGKPYNLALLQDVTERKQAEKALYASEERYRLIAQNAEDMIWTMDLDLHLTYVSPAVERALGYSAEEILALPPKRFLTPESYAAGLKVFREEVEEAQAQPDPNYARVLELEYRRRNGSTLWVETKFSLFRDSNDRPIGVLGVGRDITKRKQAEQETAWLASFPQQNPNPIVEIDSTGAVFYMNPAAQSRFLDLPTQGFKHPWLAGLEDVIASFQREGTSQLQRDVETNREWYSQLLSYLPKAGRVRLYGTEITERKQAERALRASEERFRLLFENNHTVMMLIEPVSGSIKNANPAAADFYGYPLPKLLAMNIDDINQLTHEEVYAERMRAVKEERNFFNFQHRLSNGEIRSVEVHSAPLEVEGQRLLFSIIHDITDRKQAEEQVQRQLKRLNALHMIDIAISSSFDLDIILDVVLQKVVSQLRVDASAILLFNAQFQTIEYAASRGFRSDALSHTELKLGTSYAGRAVIERKTIHISDLMETGSKLASSLLLEHESFADYYGTPLIVKGEVKGVLEIYHRSHLKTDSEWLEFLETLAGQAAIAIDNAQLFENLQRSNVNLERHVAERTAELNRTNAELEYASKIKDEFLANMSHELRTPLTSILGLSESLLEQRRGSLNDHQQRSLEVIESSGQHLLELINDILDLSKIEAGKFDYYPQPISVDEICKSSLSFVKSLAAKKSVTVTYFQDTSISKIYADPRRLKQILVNLLTNAVKFTLGKGEVILQVKADLEQDLIKFSVIDNGIGIAPENFQRLFQPFVQVDSSLNRQHEGTGLGLALVQKLTDLHGGSVQVESEVGKGSRFTVNLPCLLQELAKLEKLESHPSLLPGEQAEDAGVPGETSVHLGVILLADDNMPSILMIGEYMESYGYEVIVAHDGLEAIQRAEVFQPDIILMDIQMPSMNGLEAIIHLRGNPQFKTTPIVALTALAMPGDRERVLMAGANEYMSKPVSLKVLAKTIETMLKF